LKKTLFSLAFVATSGVYVLAANHGGTLARSDATTTLDAATAPVLPAPPGASLLDLSDPSEPPSPKAPPLIAEAQVAPSQAPTEVNPPASAPAPAPTLPRSRPIVADPEPNPDPVATTVSTGYRDGTYSGSSENAYYGRVQVQVTIANHQITGVKVLDYPQDRRTSRYINSQALPLLKREVIAANNANIDAISGATLTSEAYIRSLGRALAQAGSSNA